MALDEYRVSTGYPEDKEEDEVREEGEEVLIILWKFPHIRESDFP